MAKYKVYVGDVGTEIICDVGQDIAGATVRIDVQKPDGTSTSWSATAVGQTVIHFSDSKTFPVPGVYLVQPFVSLDSGGWDGLGRTAEIIVHDKFQ